MSGQSFTLYCFFWILAPGFLSPSVDLLMQLYSAASGGEFNPITIKFNS